jgi:hypothetical protein
MRALIVCITYTRYAAHVATERVTLTLDSATIAAARSAAGAAGMSLSAWIDKAARDRAIETAAVISAEQDRQLGREFATWDAESADRMFGNAA